jgi:hypothetical protein
MLPDLVNHLTTDAAVIAKVGDRVYPQILPQAPVFPAITYNQVSGVRERDLCGPTGRTRPRITINAWAERYADARALADAIREALSDLSGSIMGGSPGTLVDDIALDNEFDLYEEEAGTKGVHRVVQDYIISFVE